MFALLWRIDDACHWLSRWHLLPRFAFRPLCDWCDRRLLASAPDDFYVEDEPVEDVVAAFNRSEKHLTVPPTDDELAELDMTEAEFDAMVAAGEPVEIIVPRGYRCDHMSAFIGGDARWTAVPEFGCQCKPVPVF